MRAQAVRVYAWSLAALALSNCSPEAKPASVILVTIDTLRADRLGIYGGTVPTPHLDALGRDGAVFLNAFAPSPLTLPSHSSILTGTYPMYHGVRDNGRYRLSEDMMTLAEILKIAGYSTAAFVGGFPVDSRFGLDQGFDHYDDSFTRSSSRLAFAERRAEDVVDAARRWLETNGQRPCFIWLHLFDPHEPYEPPAPFESSYEGEIAYVDRSLKELLSSVGEDDLIVVVADHGEGLGEHGERTHSLFIYDSTLRIPLMMRGPGVPRKAVVKDEARAIDILPTVLELVGKEGACSHCQGKSLVPVFRGESFPSRASYAETYFPLLNLGWSELRSLRKDGWKYIAAPEPELYDIRSDPGENRNLAPTNHEKLIAMASELEKLEETTRRATRTLAPAADPETVSMLRGLGYLSTANPPAVGPAGTRRDPKTRLLVWEGIRVAMGYVAQGQMDQAIVELEAVLGEEPELLLARSYLAVAYFERGRYSDATEQCAAILNRDPNDVDATLLLGKALARTGRESEAGKVYARAAQIDPGSATPWVEQAQLHFRRKDRQQVDAFLGAARERDRGASGVLLLEGKLAMLDGDSEGAEKLFRSALGADKFEEEPRVQLGNLLLTQRRLDEAEALFREGLRFRPHVAGFHLGLGHSQALAGKMAEAIGRFEKAFDLEPDSTMVLNSLAFAYLEAGKVEKARALLRRSLEIQPDQPELKSFFQQDLRDNGKRALEPR